MSEENEEIVAGADRVVRAMTQDGAFRVIAVVMTDTCAEAARRQDATEATALRHLLCGAVLIRETMQPGNRVQIILKDGKGHSVVADSLPDGHTRGIVNPGGSQSKQASGLLQVNYTLRNGDLHQGIVGLDEDFEVSTALMRYLQESEQITVFVCIESLPGPTPAVGGFVVQVTPETEREGLTAMTERLESFGSLASWLEGDNPDPRTLIADLLPDHEYAILSDSALSFGCTCSADRMLIGLSTLAKGEIAELLTDGKSIEVSCDACGARYDIGTDQVAGLLTPVPPPDGELPN